MHTRKINNPANDTDIMFKVLSINLKPLSKTRFNRHLLPGSGWFPKEKESVHSIGGDIVKVQLCNLIHFIH